MVAALQCSGAVRIMNAHVHTLTRTRINPTEFTEKPEGEGGRVTWLSRFVLDWRWKGERSPKSALLEPTHLSSPPLLISSSGSTTWEAAKAEAGIWPSEQHLPTAAAPALPPEPSSGSHRHRGGRKGAFGSPSDGSHIRMCVCKYKY